VSTGWGAGITAASAIADRILPIVDAPLQQNPYITYDTDGMQALMQLAPGDCAVGTVMFATPGTVPAAGSAAPPFTLQVPAAAKSPPIIVAAPSPK
jgi:hypothetical protein